MPGRNANRSDDNKNQGWGARRASADKEVRRHTSTQASDKQNGKGIVKGTAEARGQAITDRADLNEAARIARKNGGN